MNSPACSLHPHFILGAVASFLLLSVTPKPGFGARAFQATPSSEPATVSEWQHIHGGPNADAHLRVEKAVRCNCGCLLDLHLCQTQMQCETSQAWSQRIFRELDGGSGEETVLAGFTAKFGPTALMSPPRTGLNLLGYFLPWIAIVLTAGMLGSLLRKRSREPSPASRTKDLRPEEMARVTRESALLEEEERRATEF